MNEVSCKTFDLFWRPLARKGARLEDLVEATTVPLAKLQDKRARLDWSDYCDVMRNMRRCFSDEEYVELGRSFMRSPGLRFAMVIARLGMSPMDFYRWFSKPREGVGNQMFSCIVPSHRELAPFDIELDLVLPEGFEVCWDFFLLSKGNMEELPVLLGYPRAQCTLTRLPNGGRLRIKVPHGTAVLRRMWRFLVRPFVRRDAAKELRSAHETLVERYEQLESADRKLGRQAQQLVTAHTINELVQRDVAVERLLRTIAEALVGTAGFAWSEIQLPGIDGARATHGALAGEPIIEHVLVARGDERVGELRVSAEPGADRDERAALLAFLTPSLGVALQNAIYRGGLERLVDERTEALREAQRGRERFFGNISHEIRTPLSIVLLAVADIERRAAASLDARSAAGLGAIHDAARKLLRLVDELLLLAAGQEGKLKLAPTPTDLVVLVTSLVAAWTPAAEHAGLTFTHQLPDTLVARVDPVALERVLTNLVSNAMKYTPRGGAVEIHVRLQPDGICLAVLDTGPGIPADLRDRLFGRFERADETRTQATGTGIGLALVKQLVEQHGGTVEAHARATGGTELRVMLPASRIALGAQPVAVSLQLADHARPPAPQAGGFAAPEAVAEGTILLAEDDPQLSTMIAELLSDTYVVHVANDGARALELARAHQPQLLITDIDMPLMDGLELARRFREATNDRLAPIIILSAVLDLGTRVAGLDAGAVDYVTKPFDPQELRARVRSQFRQRDLAVRLHRAERLSTLSVLTSGLAHELRNPANGVVNAIAPLKAVLPPELLREGEPAAELLEVLGDCASQIHTLAKQLLGFRDDQSLELRPADLGELLRRAISITRAALMEVEVRVQVPADLVIPCAPPLLLQVFTNLLENAAHAAGTGGWVSLAVSGPANGAVTVTVIDSGPGVPAALRSKVFEPFFTTKAQGQGTGLGLPVAREIVVRHGGSLDVHERGAGTAFVVRLPCDIAVDAVPRDERSSLDSRTT